MKGLTERQEYVLRYVQECVTARGYPPTLVEIMAEFGFTSLRGASVHLEALEAKGMLYREIAQARSMKLTCLGKRTIGAVPTLRGKFGYFRYDEERRCMVALEASNEHSNA